MDVEEFASSLSPTILPLIDFQGHGERLKTTKIRFRKILNLAHLFKRQFRYPVKYRMTSNLQILKEEMLLLNLV